MPVAPTGHAALPLLSRELSIIAFNRRVLAQAGRDDVPVLERLRYVTIVSSNLDEFFEVRFGDLIEAARLCAPRASPLADPAVVAEAVRALVAEQYEVLNTHIVPALASAGVDLHGYSRLDGPQRDWVAGHFAQHVEPLLVPVELDPAHPFPAVANKSLNFVVALDGPDALGHRGSIAVVKVPRALPRVIRLPDELCAGRQLFVLLSSVIRNHLGALFPGRSVAASVQFRVTRDSDLEVDDEDTRILSKALRSRLTTRHFGQAVRVEVAASCPADLAALLLDQFSLQPELLYRVDGPVNLVRLAELVELAREPVSGAPIRFAHYEASVPLGRLPRGRSIFGRMRESDVLLHHPFESFEPVVRFLAEAVRDPCVLAIKVMVYRTGAQSVLMDLLIDAARRGKEVLAVVELKARFDEEANIDWAERLEAVGAQVVYGIVGLKTHAKMMLVTRREAGAGGRRSMRHYLHLSTGNYHPHTARLYTDLGYLTADRGLAEDAAALFQQMASLIELRPPRHLVTAPFSLHARLLGHLDQVTQAARAGVAARVVCKVNGLTDPSLMDALVAAAQAGTEIDLVVRGACMLPPGIAGSTERIRVRSVVGRFLEHTRILYFRWGLGPHDEVLYLTSADLMSRNMFRRVEVAWPVRDAALRQRVIDECLLPYLHDRRDAWQLHADGSYTRIGGDGASAQQALMQRFKA